MSGAKSGVRKSRGAKRASKARPPAGVRARSAAARRSTRKTAPPAKRAGKAKTATKRARSKAVKPKRTASRKAAAENARFAPAASRDVVVTVQDSHMPRIKKVAASLRSRGMKVDSVLESTGHITGSVSSSGDSLNEIEGVAGIEESPHFQLPPPDSDVQ
jgi:hypothetical protein